MEIFSLRDLFSPLNLRNFILWYFRDLLFIAIYTEHPKIHVVLATLSTHLTFGPRTFLLTHSIVFKRSFSEALVSFFHLESVLTLQ
jgi:hypothetical protein